MILHQKMFQALVDKLIEDIGYNINIIDPKGIIVASGSPQRINTFHSIGREAALTEQRIDMAQADEKYQKGVKEGINQPFYYQKRLAGVIGITGKISEVEEFVRIVKTMIELMVEQEMLKQKMFHRKSNKSYFANLLVNCKSEEDKITLSRWASELGYDLGSPRSVIVVALEGNRGDDTHIGMPERIKASKDHGKQDFAAMISSDQMLILKTHKHENVFEYLKKYCEDIAEIIQKSANCQVHIGIGSHYPKIEDQQKSYNEALFSIQQSRINLIRVGYIQDYLLEYMTSKVDAELMDHFVMKHLSKLSNAPELVETLIAFVRNQMNLVKTAEHMYLHRNTVVFRLAKIKELTGLDLTRNHRDRILGHLIAAYANVSK